MDVRQPSTAIAPSRTSAGFDVASAALSPARERRIVLAFSLGAHPLAIEKHADTLWRFHARSDDLTPMEAIVCLGSYDLRVAHRTADLALEYPQAKVLVTGSYGNWTRGVFKATEAETFGGILLERGVPEDRILLEPRATNIGENIAFARDMLGYASGEAVVFVTKPQTQMRVRATVPVHWAGITARLTAPRLTMADYETPTDGLAPLIEEMVGDFQRMQLYPDLGFQVPVETPPEAFEAFEALKSAGFVRHLTPAG